ncbi:MAG TPA: alpha/beta fold hydrolase [Longimicrobiales bacterium]|nr:alpha/beta fold hydrolase [Longimicrobiales bacterium]
MRRPEWLDPALYPFEPHFVDVDGGRMHYVDEGEGPVVLMVHGTPTWSFLYRNLIRDLARDHRVIAPDNLGFGLSEKPREWGYRPADHAANLARLVEALELRDFVLVVHDFGGPIGLSHAAAHPERVRGIVLFNTWLWSLRGSPAERIGRVMGGAVGRFLYTRLNFSPRIVLPAAYGDRRKLSREVHRHYLMPFASRADRPGTWILARELLASSEWYDGLWHQRDRLAIKPALILWGMKDPAFGPDYLERWRAALPRARVVEIPEAGHFVQEEAPETSIREIRSFISSLPHAGSASA